MGNPHPCSLLSCMKKAIGKVIFILLLFIGFGLMFYPQISNYINRIHSSKVIQSFKDQMVDAPKEEVDRQMALARDYSESLKSTTACSVPYEDILNFGDGLMGYVSIPCIGVQLPVYHGVSTAVLSKGVGHMPATAFPVGGAGNHSVLTGHTGLPSAELFTGLTKMKVGDRFHITVADSVFAYEVDQIKTVSPLDGSDLVPVSGEDYCTLLTCTPYGINSHRLLVRGRRIAADNGKTQGEINTEATLITPIAVMPFVAVPLLLIILFLHIPFRRKE